jgi:hypothetical protein
MTIGLPNDRVWQAANWVVRGFCDDARPHLAGFPLLAERIERNYLTELWSFDVEDDPAELDEMQRLVARVIADNETTGGARFHDPTAFPAYLGKLRELAELVEQARYRPPPGGPRTVHRGRVIVGEGLYLAAGQGVFRGHLAEDPQQKRLVTQANLHDISPAGFALRWKLDIEGIAPLEYAGPIDQPDHIGWNGHCIVEVEPRGQPAIELAPIDEKSAVLLAVDVLEVVARAHAARLEVGGIRPELIYARRDTEGRPRLAGLVPRSPMFLARAYPLSSGSPPFTRLYTALHDPPDERQRDIYAVAMTFIHLVQGAHPFGDHYLEEVPRMAAGERPAWRGSPRLGEALISGLEKDPKRRPRAEELAARLRAAL